MKYRAVGIEALGAGPFVDGFLEHKATRCHFINHELGRDAVPSSVSWDTFWRPGPDPGESWRKIDDDEEPARAQRLEEAGIDLCGVGQVVIHPSQHDGVATGRRQSRFAGPGLHDCYIAQIFFCDCCAQGCQTFGVDIARKDTTA